MDAAEAPGPAGEVRRVLPRSPAKAGLHRTSHASEDAPPVNITTCLDVLGCERIDHGYHILDDDDGRRALPRRRHPLHVLPHVDRGGLRLARPHHPPHQRHDRGGPARPPQLRRPDDVPHRHRQGVRRLRRARTSTRPRWRRRWCFNGVDAAWLDAAEKARLRQGFGGEIAALDAELDLASRAVMLSNTDPALRRAWHVVARSTDVGIDPRRRAPARGRRGRWCGSPTAVPGETRLAAFADRCPHRLAPLSAGLRRRRHPPLRLPRLVLRRRRRVHRDPRDRRPRTASRRAPGPRRPAGLVERAGLVFLAPEASADRAARRALRRRTPRSCTACSTAHRRSVGAGLMIDNFLDMAHFPFVHAATIGTATRRASCPTPPSSATASAWSSAAAPIPEPRGPRRAASSSVPCCRSAAALRVPRPVLGVPAHRLREAGGTNVLDFFVQPEDDEQLPHLHGRAPQRSRRRRARLADCVAFERKILDEDLGLQERYVDRRLPLDLTTEVHVRPTA